MKPEIIKTTILGYPAVGLRSAAIELVMIPQLGGRIISLKNLTTQREWLWHQNRPDWLWANGAGDNFGLSPQAGIDECIPSVASCNFKGRQIPDHGEVWYRAWELDATALEQAVLASKLELSLSPFNFSRSIRLMDDHSFVFEYELENRSTEAEPFIWCIHPLKNIQPGDRVILPQEVTSLRLDGGIGVPINRGDLWQYPEPFPGIRLDSCQVPGNGAELCVKGFAGPLTEGFAAIENQHTGDRLELFWDPQLVPYAGLWINRGLGGFHHVALEPCTGIPDSLAISAQEWNEVRTIKAGATLRWSLTVRIS
jgi:galactose mutarotase-like enzyme